VEKFRVWISLMPNACQFQVDGGENARWLLSRLSQSFVFKSSEPIRDLENSSYSTFLVPYNFQNTPFSLRKLLVGIPQVMLMSGPA
jgi:hypothetical protein